MSKKCTVIITEDDKEDADFLQQAFINSSFTGNIQHLGDGVQLMNKLSELKNTGTLPELIVLDLNMPYKNGLEVLEEMNNDPEYKKIPVAVLTASLHHQDEENCGSLGCDLFIRKPIRFDEYNHIAERMVVHIRERFSYC